MDIIQKKIKEIVPYANNAKEHPQWQIDQIKASIKEFGFNDPIAIDENNVIIEGHGRFMALQQLGYTEVEVIQLCHLSEIKKKQYILAHNKLNLNTGFNIEKLKLELEEIQISGEDLTMTGFSLEEIKELNLEIEDPFEEVEILEDEVPEVQEEHFSQRGDIWILGDHKLMCGDSTNPEDVEKLMQEEKADLVVTDPPYNVNYQGGTEEKLMIENDNMSDSEFYNFLLAAYKNMFSFTSEGGGIYVFHADTEGINFRKAMIDAGFKYSQSCIWVKNSLVMGRQDYHWQHEPVLVGWKPGKAHNWYSDRKQTTVWNFNKPLKNNVHPTMKPLDLIAYPITNSSKKGDLVLDLFGGSGSTLIACEQTGRRCRTMELDPRYADVIAKRYFNLGKRDLKLLREGVEIELTENFFREE